MSYKAPAGAVVVQNYQNGHIIALASYPTFDNRWFESDLGDGKFEKVFPTVVDPVTGKVDPDTSTLTNRAIQGRYNLGSTFKPFTAYAALNTGLIGVNDYYQDTGRYTMESVAEDKCNSGLVRCVYKNATCESTQRPCVYGNVDVETALAVSSDSFFYRLFYDTVKGGDFRAREANVYRLAEVSVDIIDQCVAQGVPFAREYGGLLDNRSFGGAQVSRTFYARGQTGQQLLLGAYQALDAAGRPRATSSCTPAPRCSTSS